MTTDTRISETPANLMAELHRAMEEALKGRPDPDAMLEACEEQDRTREEQRRLSGELNVAVDLIREVRDNA
jgi:hypothetical protein